MKEAEEIVFYALKNAARDYQKSDGPFIPFAQKRIHADLKAWSEARVLLTNEEKCHSGKYPGTLDTAAFKRGFLACGGPVFW
jgi:hypothetical protein